jgi:type I restriction enzyme S subunit
MMERWTLPEGWGWIRLGEVSQIIMGQSPPGNTYNNTGNGLPFFQGKADFGEVQPIPRKWCTQPTKISDVGDVLISVRAPVGPVNLTAEKCIIGRGLAAIRPETNIETKYLFYLLHAFKNLIESMGTGSTFQAISKRDLQSFEIPIPYPDDPARSLAEQRRIVARLEALLGEVKALREQVQTMWRDLNRLMESALAEVFPAAGQPLPEGWEWKELNSLVTIKYGNGLSQRSRIHGSVPVYGANGIIGYHNAAITRGETIIIGRKGSAGAVSWSDVPCWPIDTTFFIDEFPKNIFSRFLYHILHSQNLERLQQSAAIPGLNREILYRVLIPLPNLNDPERSLSEQRRIVAYLDGIQQTVREAQELIQSDLRAIEQLEQSILAAAFRGEL